MQTRQIDRFEFAEKMYASPSLHDLDDDPLGEEDFFDDFDDIREIARFDDSLPNFY